MTVFGKELFKVKVDHIASDANLLDQNTCRIFSFGRPLCRHLSEPLSIYPTVRVVNLIEKWFLHVGVSYRKTNFTLLLTTKSRNAQRRKCLSCCSESYIALWYSFLFGCCLTLLDTTIIISRRPLLLGNKSYLGEPFRHGPNYLCWRSRCRRHCGSYERTAIRTANDAIKSTGRDRFDWW